MTLFDQKAESYDDFCRTPLGHFVDAVERRLIGAMARPRAGESAIDLGCGTGSYTYWLHKLGLSVTGVDLSEKMLEVARRKGDGRVPFIRADVTHLPFPPDSYDLALANATLEFVADPKAALREAYRVVKPGGRVVVGFIAKLGPWAEQYSKRGREDATSVYHGARFFSYGEAVEIGPCIPEQVRFGLYVSPREFTDEASAWSLEMRRRVSQDEAGAGFMVVRWRKGTLPV